MNIDKRLLQKTGRLAQLDISAKNEAVLLEDVNKIVVWMNKLAEVDTTGISPLVTMTPKHHVLVLQDDVPEMPLTHAQGLANAPSKDTNYFRVPQVKE
mmetsp:Transcript_4616/g.10368  ORF Transcript_4616/g.10368 Transcript_4616/m.10368 type:complete len:98 (+) Transcript_4616:171-464(+)